MNDTGWHPVALTRVYDACGLTIDLHRYLTLKHVCDLRPGRLMPRLGSVRRKIGRCNTTVSFAAGALSAASTG
jgi:hypothetical protein